MVRGLLRTDISATCGLMEDAVEDIKLDVKIHLNYATRFLVNMAASTDDPLARVTVINIMAEFGELLLANEDMCRQVNLPILVPESLGEGIEAILGDMRWRGEEMAATCAVVDQLDRDYQAKGLDFFKGMTARVRGGTGSKARQYNY